jgi:hypothetical protein
MPAAHLTDVAADTAAAAQAELVLLAAALQDPLNTKFLLVSDSSLPLYPPQLLWAQLMSEPVSRIDACQDRPDKTDFYRWDLLRVGCCVVHVPVPVCWVCRYLCAGCAGAWCLVPHGCLIVALVLLHLAVVWSDVARADSPPALPCCASQVAGRDGHAAPEASPLAQEQPVVWP